jgi:formamidopyrimidine-DNA glycosylase
MPELPEVETVARGMAGVLVGQRLTLVDVRRADLRRPFPVDLRQRLTGAIVTRIHRRAKYAILDTDREDSMILHLGMSGRVVLDPGEIGKHDHLVFETAHGRRLALNDARRFGSVDLVPTVDLPRHPLLAHLGPEPLSDDFSPETLRQAFLGKKAPLKAALLDQTIVAGLGNIYVCEALFRAGLRPERAAATVKRPQLVLLTQAIKDVLERAIAVGGSSLKDYVQVDGELGYFQHEWAVYGRAGAPCRVCTEAVLRVVQSGRSSFYCAACQR